MGLVAVMDTADDKHEESKGEPTARDEEVEHAVVELEQSMGHLRQIVNRLKSVVWKNRLKSDEPLVPVVASPPDEGVADEAVGDEPAAEPTHEDPPVGS